MSSHDDKKNKPTLKLKAEAKPRGERAPVRGMNTPKKRPTLAEAQAEREARERRTGYAQRPPRADEGARFGSPKGERPPRRDDRPQGERGDRPPRREGGGYGDRPPRREDSNYGDRPPRREGGGYGDRPPRREGGGVGGPSERPPRAGEGDRPPRREGGSYGDRPPRREGGGYGDRPPRREGGGFSGPSDRPPRSGEGGRPPRREGGGYGDRPPRREGGSYGDRPPRREGGGFGGPAGRPPHGGEGQRPQRRDEPVHADRPPRAERPPQRLQPEGEGERLSKLMAERGLASRREADEWIEMGWVKVDGRRAVLGQRVGPEVQIDIDPAARKQQAQRVTILLHKPIGLVSGQPEDGYEPAVSLIRADTRWAEDPTQVHLDFNPAQLRGLAPAGRLDIDSTGLLVFTQDGRVAKALIGDDSEVEKEYLVRVALVDAAEGAPPPMQAFPAEGLARLAHGLELDGVQLREAKVSWANEDQLRFVLREGRKRQIRRMCELVGLKVLALKRVRMGRIPLSALPLGQWRYLAPWEKF